MLTSELIQQLQNSLTEHGDLPVYIVDDDATNPVGSVDVQEPNRDLVWHYGHSAIEDVPKRIVIR